MNRLSLYGILFILFLWSNNSVSQESRSLRKDFDVFQKVLSIINRRYVESVDNHELMQDAISGMVKSLDDPYSGYLLPKDKEKFDKTMGQDREAFVGIGVELGIADGNVEVIAPIPDTPAFEAGVKAGDTILAVDGIKIYDLEQASSNIRGEAGTPVILTIDRIDIPEPFNLTIIRKAILVESVRKYELPNNVGYIRLTTFKFNSGEEIRQALDYLNLAGMKSLIFDLRNNPGGLLDVSLDVANNFLTSGEIIVSVRGRKKSDEVVYKANGNGLYYTLPVVLLVNEFSASASEIVTGALKDNKRAIIMGKRTYGKGSVQEIIPLDDGSALRLTIARYYTPNDILIHQVGIYPDIELTPKMIASVKSDESVDFPILRDPAVYLAYQHIVSGTP